MRAVGVQRHPRSYAMSALRAPSNRIAFAIAGVIAATVVAFVQRPIPLPTHFDLVGHDYGALSDARALGFGPPRFGEPARDIKALVLFNRTLPDTFELVIEAAVPNAASKRSYRLRVGEWTELVTFGAGSSTVRVVVDDPGGERVLHVEGVDPSRRWLELEISRIELNSP